MKYFILFFFMSIISYSQNVTSSSIREKGDSLIRSQVGNKLLKYFEFDKKLSYMGITSADKNITIKFQEETSIEGTFSGAFLCYHFKYPKIKGIKSYLYMYLDNNYNIYDKYYKPINELNLKFVPDFLIQDKPSNFILPEKAKIIATKLFEHKGIRITDAELEYNDDNQEYRYIIKNIRDEEKNKLGEIIFTSYDGIELNAITGKLVNKSSIIDSSNAFQDATK